MTSEKRQAELQRRLAQRDKNQKRSHAYIYYLIVILTLVYIIDEIISNLQTNLMPEMVASIFPDLGLVAGSKKFGLVSGIAIAMMAFSMFYKPLADRFGRKPFLVLNTLGMGAAVALCTLARNSGSFFVYWIGFFMLRFFVTPDEQVVYIFETVNEKHRATVYSLIKGVAEIGLVVIPLLRSLLFKVNLDGSGTESNPDNWRIIFLICAGIAFVVALFCLLFTKETDAFLDSRIAYLKKSDEELQAEKGFKNASKAQGGFFKSLAMVFQSKQLLFICIATAIYCAATSLVSYYSNLIENPILEGFKTGIYATEDAAQAAATAQLNKALFIFPFTCGALTLVYGFLSDKFGRKKVAVALLSLVTVAFVLFIVGNRYGWSIYLLGALIGIFLAGYWGTGDTYIMMIGESSPTNMRASAITANSLFFGIGQGLSTVLIMLVPEKNPDLFCLFISVPCFIISLALIMIFVKETKGIKIEDAGKELLEKQTSEEAKVEETIIQETKEEEKEEK